MGRNISSRTTLAAAASLLVFGVVLLSVRGTHAESVFLIAPVNLEESTTQSQRIDERKNDFRTQLDGRSTADLAAKCAKAQKIAASLKDKDTKILQKRQEFYINSSNKLQFAVDNLNKLKIDTARLVNAQQQFIIAANKYFSDAQIYKAAIDDLAGMDCSKDTAGFKATLLSARKLRAQLAADTAAVTATFPNIKSAAADAKGAL